MVISGLGLGGVKRNKAMAQPARTFMPGSMAAQQHLGKCVELTAANSLDVAAKEAGWIHGASQCGREVPARQSPEGIAVLAGPLTKAVRR